MNRSPTTKSPWWEAPLAIVAAVVALPFLLLIVPFIALLLIVKSVCLHFAAWCCWNAQGRDILFVYSNSSVWQERIEKEVLPLVRDRVVILNWSERKQWRFGLMRAAFYHFGGEREFNPMAVVFRPFRRARVFRFWRPYRDWKHGKTEPLQRLEHDFFQLIGNRAEMRAA